jgi:hypothetical protein
MPAWPRGLFNGGDTLPFKGKNRKIFAFSFGTLAAKNQPA